MQQNKEGNGDKNEETSQFESSACSEMQDPACSDNVDRKSQSDNVTDSEGSIRLDREDIVWRDTSLELFKGEQLKQSDEYQMSQQLRELPAGSNNATLYEEASNSEVTSQSNIDSDRRSLFDSAENNSSPLNVYLDTLPQMIFASLDPIDEGSTRLNSLAIASAFSDKPFDRDNSSSTSYTELQEQQQPTEDIGSLSDHTGVSPLRVGILSTWDNESSVEGDLYSPLQRCLNEASSINSSDVDERSLYQATPMFKDTETTGSSMNYENSVKDCTDIAFVDGNVLNPADNNNTLHIEDHTNILPSCSEMNNSQTVCSEPQGKHDNQQNTTKSCSNLSNDRSISSLDTESNTIIANSSEDNLILNSRDKFSSVDQEKRHRIFTGLDLIHEASPTYSARTSRDTMRSPGTSTNLDVELANASSRPLAPSSNINERDTGVVISYEHHSDSDDRELSNNKSNNSRENSVPSSKNIDSHRIKHQSSDERMPLNNVNLKVSSIDYGIEPQPTDTLSELGSLNVSSKNSGFQFDIQGKEATIRDLNKADDKIEFVGGPTNGHNENLTSVKNMDNVVNKENSEINHQESPLEQNEFSDASAFETRDSYGSVPIRMDKYQQTDSTDENKEPLSEISSDYEKPVALTIKTVTTDSQASGVVARRQDLFPTDLSDSRENVKTSKEKPEAFPDQPLSVGPITRRSIQDPRLSLRNQAASFSTNEISPSPHNFQLRRRHSLFVMKSDGGFTTTPSLGSSPYLDGPNEGGNESVSTGSASPRRRLSLSSFPKPQSLPSINFSASPVSRKRVSTVSSVNSEGMDIMREIFARRFMEQEKREHFLSAYCEDESGEKF